jgi:protein-tyrosine phosphatase
VSARILLVCRANLCRSPSAEVMLSRALSMRANEAAPDVEVTSAGMEVLEGQYAPEDFIEIALVRGIDLRAHRPVALTKGQAEGSDLVLTMTRDLLRSMVVAIPTIWPRSFTLLELVRRGTTATPPVKGESLSSWIGRVHASRDRAELLGTEPVDDLRDPLAEESEGNEAMFGDLERATRRLARLLLELDLPPAS